LVLATTGAEPGSPACCEERASVNYDRDIGIGILNEKLAGARTLT
jgi:hypothetical protein